MNRNAITPEQAALIVGTVLESAEGKGEQKVTTLIGQPRDGVWAGLLSKMAREQREELGLVKAENADLKARLERLEGLVKDRPYLTASTEPVLSKVEGPVQ